MHEHEIADVMLEAWWKQEPLSRPRLLMLADALESLYRWDESAELKTLPTEIGLGLIEGRWRILRSAMKKPPFAVGKQGTRVTLFCERGSEAERAGIAYAEKRWGAAP